MSSNLLALGIGLGVLSVGTHFLLKGGLKNDNSPMGITVKVVFVAVGLALVLLPLKAMLGSKAQQKQWRSQLHKGVRRSGQTLRDEFGSVKSVARTMSRQASKIASRARKSVSLQS